MNSGMPSIIFGATGVLWGGALIVSGFGFGVLVAGSWMLLERARSSGTGLRLFVGTSALLKRRSRLATFYQALQGPAERSSRIQSSELGPRSSLPTSRSAPSVHETGTSGASSPGSSAL